MNKTVRCIDWYSWQHPKLPKIGEFSTLDRIRGARKAAVDNCKRATENAVELFIAEGSRWLLNRFFGDRES